MLSKSVEVTLSECVFIFRVEFVGYEVTSDVINANMKRHLKVRVMIPKPCRFVHKGCSKWPLLWASKCMNNIE